MVNEEKPDDLLHVHFSEDTDEIGHTLINIKIKDDFNIEAHVGFLKVNHTYSIDLNVPRKFKKLPKVKEEVPSLSWKITKIELSKDCHLFLEVHFFAYKEKLLREKITLLDEDEKEICLTMFARVLGKGKGTPMLRENVTCIGAKVEDDETEASDWQGFD